MNPTLFELEAYIYAVEAHNDHERYGLPYEGGVRDQPWIWKLAVDCVISAQTAAIAAAHAQARENQAQELEEY